MTCPIDALPAFYCEHRDVYELCDLMECAECTAEDGEGVFWDAGAPMAHTSGPDDCGDWDIPF
ncbi:MAG TPA: hypothetical protein DCP91_00330 [Eggerthellaceae bacterium]|nr:hypothetical protein [Eggerthellaceae bacterium]